VRRANLTDIVVFVDHYRQVMGKAGDKGKQDEGKSSANTTFHA
jgi:hypothetical protein